jgi:hypothetical protein
MLQNCKIHHMTVMQTCSRGMPVNSVSGYAWCSHCDDTSTTNITASLGEKDNMKVDPTCWLVIVGPMHVMQQTCGNGLRTISRTRRQVR